jgi:small subunit ribosomal protein S16
MAVKIRLRRMGANKKPFFRIVAADVRSANAGNFLDELGWYEPGKKTDNYKLDLAKAEKWISTGAQPSETVAILIKKSRIAAAKAPAVAIEAPASE